MIFAQAVTGSWDQPGDGRGVYDPEKWAVVFKYSAVTISQDRSLSFSKHPSGAPVVWLVSGNVTLNYNSLIHLYGQGAQFGTAFPLPGPGGFRGGRGGVGVTPGSAGFGPGGGDYVLGAASSAGSYGTAGGAYGGIPAAPVYGNSFILPLIGGSGGANDALSGGDGGGAGGGAILIAATATIAITGPRGIYAYGGNGWLGGGGSPGGSGGAIRLIADRIQGNGLLRAQGGTGVAGYDVGGKGRIFVQANDIALTDPGDPARVDTDFVNSPYLIWSPDGSDPQIPAAPEVWPVKLVVDGVDVPIPADPRARLDYAQADAIFDTQTPVTLHIEAANVPLDWLVAVRVVAKAGDSFTVMAEPLQGDPMSSTTTAQLTLPRGFGAVQVRAYAP